MSEASGPGETSQTVGDKKPYAPPVLTLFGHVAALTQGSNCSANNDGAGSCPSTGGTDMGMTGSDRRLKHDIVPVGRHPLGFGLYLFRYREGDGARHFGVMADEVQPIVPQAVSRREDGFLAVDYRMLGIRPALH